LEACLSAEVCVVPVVAEVFGLTVLVEPHAGDSVGCRLTQIDRLSVKFRIHGARPWRVWSQFVLTHAQLAPS
jgi:hypothetical protein